MFLMRSLTDFETKIFKTCNTNGKHYFAIMKKLSRQLSSNIIRQIYFGNILINLGQIRLIKTSKTRFIAYAYSKQNSCSTVEQREMTYK